jgi:putative thioredoxin
MTQQPFSRPGAIDLSALKRSAPTGGAAAGGGAAGGAGGPYSVQLDEQNIQRHLEASMNAPVVLAVYSPATAPDSARLADDLAVLADEFEGRFLLGRVDVDANPQLAQALQIPSVPLVALVVQGRMMPLLQDTPAIEDLRELLTQVLQQMVTQGVTGRHQPLPAAGDPGDPSQLHADPRYVLAQEALAEGDLDRAVAEYQRLVELNPADNEAAGGLAMAKVLQRTKDVDAAAVRADAAANRDDVDAQTLCADLDMLGGHVEDAFNRLIEVVRRTSGAERDLVRTHLIGLFAAVGNDDPRVLKGRAALASALF